MKAESGYLTVTIKYSQWEEDSEYPIFDSFIDKKIRLIMMIDKSLHK